MIIRVKDYLVDEDMKRWWIYDGYLGHEFEVESCEYQFTTYTISAFRILSGPLRENIIAAQYCEFKEANFKSLYDKLV